MKIHTQNRKYRSLFSQAYKHLYKEGELSYLTEILDSAQEGIPCLWVNSEKYSFSKEVLNNGKALFDSFCALLVTIRTCFNRYFFKIALNLMILMKILVRQKKI